MRANCGSWVQMFRQNGCIGSRCGTNNPRNSYINGFMLEMRDKSKVIDYDFPRDEKLADNGARMANIRRASFTCTQMISVSQC